MLYKVLRSAEYIVTQKISYKNEGKKKLGLLFYTYWLAQKIFCFKGKDKYQKN